MDLSDLLHSFGRIIAAFVIALPIGWERATGSHGPGLRTYPLLAMGAAAFVVIAQHAFPDTPEAEARMIQGLVSGVGFIGAGAIVKGEEIHGVASAVSIWVTMAVGMATAYELYAIAILLSLATLLALRFLIPMTPNSLLPREELEKAEPDDSEGANSESERGAKDR